MDIPTDADPQETREWLEALEGVLDRRARAGPLAHRAAHRQGAPLRRLPAVLGQHRVREHHPGGQAAAPAGRLRARAAHPPLRALERHGDGGARQQAHQRRRPHRELRLGRHALRRRLQPLLAAPRQDDTAATWSSSRATPRPASTPAPTCSGCSPRSSSTSFRQEVDGKGHLVLPAPLADAGLLAVPHRVHGARAAHGHLPGALHEVPARPRPLPTPRGARSGRFCGDGEMDEPESMGAIGMAGREKLDNLIFVVELQPAAARRPGARQRQDHPGAGERVPRRRLERHQGHLGPALGPAARPRQERRPAGGA